MNLARTVPATCGLALIATLALAQTASAQTVATTIAPSKTALAEGFSGSSPAARLQLAVRTAVGELWVDETQLDLLRLELIAVDQEASLSISGRDAFDGISLAPGRWRIHCQSGPFWCPTTEIRVQLDRETNREEVVVSRLVEFRGRIKIDEGLDLPRSLRFQTRVYGTASGNKLLGMFDTETEILDGGEFTVALPDATLDLRIAADGFAPQYLWAVQHGQSIQSLGSIRMLSGGSISGFVEDGESGRPANGVEVEARSRVADEATPTARRARSLSPRVRTNDNGFFQIAGLAAGIYDLIVTAPEKAPRRIPDVSITGDEEVHLSRDIVLDTLATAALWIDPPLHPDLGPWTVEVSPSEWQDTEEVPSVSKRATENGLILLENFVPGRHKIQVRTSKGNVYWVGEETIVDQAQVPIGVPLVELIGHVTLNDASVVGRLQLQAGAGDSIRLESDVSGNFRGWIRAPEFNVLFVDIDGILPAFTRQLTLRDQRAKNGKLRLDLDLSGRTVRGLVVDSTQQPVRGAKVAAWQGDTLAGEDTSEVDGSFELLALDLAPHSISARHRVLGDSDQIEIDLGNVADEIYVELSLAPRSTFVGRLTTATQQAVPGASVQLSTVGPSPTEVTQPTDLEGLFSFRLDARTEAAIIRTLAPAHGLRFGCYSMGLANPLAVSLTEGSGTLEIRVHVDQALPPTTHGGLVLFSGDRGFVSSSTLRTWFAMGGGETRWDEDSGIETMIIRNLATGEYAVGWNDRSASTLTASVCAAGPPPQLEWTTVSAGGSANLELDVSPHQREQSASAPPP